MVAVPVRSDSSHIIRAGVKSPQQQNNLYIKRAYDMAPNKPLEFDAPRVVGVADPDIDPAGYIPFELLLSGIEVVVPLWDEPAQESGERDILTICFEQLGQPQVRVENIYEPADMQPEFIIPIGPEHLTRDGVGELWYELLDSADNPSNSRRRNLTIDHTPVPANLPEAEFEHANLHGYLNCGTVPPLWHGVTIRIPPLTGFYAGDRCEVTWRGYLSLNDSGPEVTSARKIITRPTLSEQDIREGFLLVVEPYDTHIKPMVRNASATVVYRIYRGTKLVGMSKTAGVKIDRILPGEELPCGP